MKNLLIATDFSANAKHAAEYGYQLASKLTADITLCNSFIVPAAVPDAGFVLWPMYEYDELTKDSEQELNRLKAALEENHHQTGFNPTIKCINGVGTVTDIINGIVDRKNIQLVIIGTHSANGLGQFLVGNHSRAIIDATTVPLLLVPSSANSGQIKKVVFAADFKEAEKDLHHVYDLVELIKPLNAELLIVHIVDEKLQSPELMKSARSFLSELANNADYPHIYFKTVKSETAEKGFEWLYEHGQVDILAMVHRRHSFFERIFKGSHTQKMAEHIKIPLLVMPSRFN